MSRQKPVLLVVIVFTYIILMGLFCFPTAQAQEIMNWRLTKVYWKQNAPNPYVRIVRNEADSRGGYIELEHFPTDRNCKEAAVKASYRWRFDKDISLLSGKKGDMAFVVYPESSSDTGKGCWNPTPGLFWRPGSSNDFMWTKCINDQGECRSYLQGNKITSVEVRFSSYVREGYQGQFVITIFAHGVSGGWIRQAVYEFERAVGQPNTSKETLCDQYAKAAVNQNDENIKKRCGYQGVRWQSNYNVHLGWCLGADISAIDAERMARNNDLRKCSSNLVFTNPTAGGQRIDRCLTWSQQCDQPAADKFCKDKGFSGASTWKWEYVSPTVLLGSGQVCSGNYCGGFSMIECYELRK